MFLLALIVLCVATVPLVGGRLGRLSTIEFQRPLAGVAAVALQTLILGVFPNGDPGILAGLHLVSYGLMFYFLAANLALPGVWLIGLGGACNALAIAANDGVMPAQPSALDRAGILQVPGEFANSAAVADPKLWFLGDVFALPADWPMANVFSLGDILLVVGAFVLLHRVSGSGLGLWIDAAARRLVNVGPRMELLRDQRAFRRLWVAQVVSAIGDFVYPLAVFTAVVNDDTKSSSLAFLLIAQVGPGMVVGLFCGPLIDRFSRKWMMIWADVMRGVAVVSLLLVGDPTLAHLYAVALVLGIGGALFQPAFQASLPNVVPMRMLASANAFVGVTLSLAVTVGPLLGALIVKEFGINWGFTANAASFFFSAALVWGTLMPHGAVGETAESMWHELKQGLRYIRTNRAVLAVVLIVGVITLAAGIKSPIEPLFAIRALDSGAMGYGLMGAFWGVGMVVAAIFAARADRHFGHDRLLTASVFVVGACVLLAAGAPSLWPVLALWLFAGAANTLGTVAYETLLQEQVPDAVRGRVFAALEASIQAGLLLGVGLAAVPEEVFGADRPSRPAIALSGVVFLVGGVVAWRMLRRRSTRPAGVGVPEVPFAVRGLHVVPSGTRLALVRVSVDGAVGERPVLLVDDGSRVHRLEPLPAPAAPDGSTYAYGVPQRLLALKRTALALELGGRRVVDVPR